MSETDDTGLPAASEPVPQGEPDERIGVLLVHGIGEQGCFEHLETEVRHVVRALQRAVGDNEDSVRVTVQLRTSQNGALYAQQQTWMADGEAPIWVDVLKEGRRQRFEFREVWWADLDDEMTLWRRVVFWFWGLSMWAAPFYKKPPSQREDPDAPLPGFKQMVLPDIGKVPSWRIRLHLFLVAAVALVVLFTGKALNFVLRRLNINDGFPLAELLAAYLGDVKLYQQQYSRVRRSCPILIVHRGWRSAAAPCRPSSTWLRRATTAGTCWRTASAR